MFVCMYVCIQVGVSCMLRVCPLYFKLLQSCRLRLFAFKFTAVLSLILSPFLTLITSHMNVPLSPTEIQNELNREMPGNQVVTCRKLEKVKVKQKSRQPTPTGLVNTPQKQRSTPVQCSSRKSVTFRTSLTGLSVSLLHKAVVTIYSQVVHRQVTFGIYIFTEF